MMTVRKADERGKANFDWLDSRHSFSFGQYFDPAYTGFRSLRVINEDRVAPGAGFPPHGHRDMEIITYPLDGALEHHDSAGNQGISRAGEVQLMSAGSGITHSEYNASDAEPVHFLQMWVIPAQRGGAPRYGQKHFPIAEQPDRWHLIASDTASDGSLPIGQDARLSAARLSPGKSLSYTFESGLHGWLQVARGTVSAMGKPLNAGDGAAIADMPEISLTATEDAEILLYDLS